MLNFNSNFLNLIKIHKVLGHSQIASLVSVRRKFS
jgi:hypothetical protein